MLISLSLLNRVTSYLSTLKEIGRLKQSSCPESCSSRLPNSTALDWTLSPWGTSPPGSPMPSHFFKKWAGMLAWGAVVLLGCVSCIWLLCRLKREHAQYKAVVYQALMAIKDGASPNVWLASLKN